MGGLDADMKFFMAKMEARKAFDNWCEDDKERVLLLIKETFPQINSGRHPFLLMMGRTVSI